MLVKLRTHISILTESRFLSRRLWRSYLSCCKVQGEECHLISLEGVVEHPFINNTKEEIKMNLAIFFVSIQMVLQYFHCYFVTEARNSEPPVIHSRLDK